MKWTTTNIGSNVLLFESCNRVNEGRYWIDTGNETRINNSAENEETIHLFRALLSRYRHEKTFIWISLNFAQQHFIIMVSDSASLHNNCSSESEKKKLLIFWDKKIAHKAKSLAKLKAVLTTKNQKVHFSHAKSYQNLKTKPLSQFAQIRERAHLEKKYQKKCVVNMMFTSFILFEI